MPQCPVKPFALAACLAAGSASARVVLYPAPAGMPAASDRTVQVDGQNVHVYEAPVNHNRVYNLQTATELTPMAYFDFSGSATVTVTANNLQVATAAVRPASAGIVPVISGNKITFTVTRPAHLTVEFNGQFKRALHLFADSIEANPRTGGDGSVRYFGPGIHQPNEIVVGSGQTVYIAGSAVVYGSIRGTGVGNFKLAGRGILHGGRYAREGEGPKNLINFHGSNNLSLGGVILLDSPTWNMNIRHSRDVRIDDVKIIGARANSDGIDIVSCENVFVNRAFVRGWDDNLCVKSADGANTRNVHFSQCVLWTDLAQSMEVGYETRSNLISDVSFRDIDVLHAWHKPVMSIHNGSQALVEKVRFENIRVDDSQMGQGDGQNLLIDLWIGTSVWTQADPRGRINDVTIRNVSVHGGKVPLNRIWGFGTANRVENVSISGLTIMNRKVCNKDDGQFAINAHVANITWDCGPGNPVRRTHEASAPEIRVDARGFVEFQPDRGGPYEMRVIDARGRSMGTYRGRVEAGGLIRTARLPSGRYTLSGHIGGERFSGWVDKVAGAD